jgi:hypothetical protein
MKYQQDKNQNLNENLIKTIFKCEKLLKRKMIFFLKYQ